MLILLRHGRTAANAGGLLLGRLDVGLDPRGVRQAQAAAEALRPTVSAGARVVSSPLTRTRQTASHLTATMSLDDRWIELDYGDWDGRPLGDVPADRWAEWRADPAFAPPGGESLAALGERVRRACTDLAAEAAERDVIVVTHVSPVKAAVAWALGVPDDVAWRMFVQPASIVRISTTGRTPSLVTFGDVSHLPTD